MPPGQIPKSNRRIRMLFFPRETFPTDRVRLTTLFGRELLGRGHAIDLVMQAQDDAVTPGRHDWFGRSVWVGPTDSGTGFLSRARKNILGIWHDLQMLRRACAGEYDSILVSDKYLLASLAIIVASVRNLQFFFWMTFPYHEAHVTLGKERLSRHPTTSLIRGRLAAFFLYRWIIPHSDHVFVQSERMAQICEEIRSRGETPFLHVSHANLRAKTLYDRLGFIERSAIGYWHVRRSPAGATGPR